MIVGDDPTGTDSLIARPFGAHITLDDKPFVNFAGSSYLGLSGDPEILAAGVAALLADGAGYQLARTYGVVREAHRTVETVAAAFFGTEDAVFLAGGYNAALAVLGGVASRFHRIFYDEQSHYCLKDAIAISGLPAHRFGHLSAESAAATLGRELRAGERPLLVTDAIYSTHGEIAPLVAYRALIARHGGRILVDESHALGVLGKNGRGAADAAGLAPGEAYICASTSKGLGVVGGVIPASTSDAAAFRAAPTSRAASAGLTASAAMCAASMRRVIDDPALMRRLTDHARYFKRGLVGLGIDCGNSDNDIPIAAFRIDGVPSARIEAQLKTRGILVLNSNYIGAPGDGLIRCGIFADHDREDLDCLLHALAEISHSCR